MFLLFSLACSPEFVGVAVPSGATCDVIEVQRSTDPSHRCGDLRVTFDGIPATEVCLEGTGLNACSPTRAGTDLVFTVPETWPARAGTLSVEQTTRGTGCVLFGAFPSDVFTTPFTVTEQRSAPVVSLDAEETTIARGESTTLFWDVSGPTTSVALNGDPVPAMGSRDVSPTNTQRYTLIAESGCLSGQDSVEVCVDQPQSTPTVSRVDSARPGESVTVRGSDLAHAACAGALPASLVFTQGARTFPPVVDASPADSNLQGALPTGMSPGAATVVARVGTMESSPFGFVVEGRENGAFRAVTLRSSGTHSCGRAGREVSITAGSGTSRTAVFREGSRTVHTIRFDLGVDASGAAMSPDCQHGVVVGQNTARDDDSYTLNVYDFTASSGAGDIGATQLGRGVQVLFSPDDSVVLYKAQDQFRGVGFATVNLYDMQDSRPEAGPGPGISCTACNSISGSLTSFRDVSITFDGSSLGTFRVD